MKPYISIIIPMYNCADFISNTITSVLEQTFDNWELILVNDGSTDNTLEVVEQFTLQDKRIKVISQQNSGGPSLPRNRGIMESKGVYLAFLDADDVYLPNRLEQALKVLREWDNRGCRIAVNDYSIENADNVVHSALIYRDFYGMFGLSNEVNQEEPFLTPPDALFRFSVLNHCPIHTNSITVRADLIKEEKEMFSTALKNGEDTHLWLRIISNRSVAIIPDILSIYKQRTGGLTDNAVRLALGLWSVQSEIHQKIQNRFNKSDIIRHKEKLARILYGLGYAARYQGLYLLAVFALAGSIRLTRSGRSVLRFAKTIAGAPWYLMLRRGHEKLSVRQQLRISNDIMSFANRYR